MIAKKSSALSVLVALAVAPLACGSDATTPAPAPADQGSPAVGSADGGSPDGAAPGMPAADAGFAPDAHADPGPPCTGKTRPATVDDVWTFVEAGDAGSRSARVHVPPSYDPAKSMPVVLNFHGYTSKGAEEEVLSAMPAKADKAGAGVNAV